MIARGDILLEKGELLNFLQSKYRDGRDTWLKADEVVRAWEDEYRYQSGSGVSWRYRQLSN